MISIKRIKEIREEFNFSHIVIFGFTKENGEQHVATHGKTELDSIEAADMGNNYKKDLGFPESKCNDKPLERICNNCYSLQKCKLLKSEYHECVIEPMKAIRDPEDKACSKFEPNC